MSQDAFPSNAALRDEQREHVAAIQRALAESQAQRDKLEKEVERLREELSVMEGWYPLETESTRVAVCLHGEEDAHWLAVFRDKDDAEKFASDQLALPPDDRRNVFVLDGELAGLRFWNDGIDPIPEVAAASS